MRLCSKLRWKGWYGARWASQEELDLAFHMADAPFTCLATCQPWGSDEDPCTPEHCQPGRACFQPSAKDPAQKLA
jgi:hypothetical protein